MAPQKGTIGVTTVPGLVGIVNNNADQQVADEQALAALQAQVTALMAAAGNPPNNAYVPITPAASFLYSASAATKGGWATATSKGAVLFGTPFNAQANYNLPTVVALPWDMAARSMLFAYMPATAAAPATGSGLTATSDCYARRVVLDANGVPSVTAADVQLPSFAQSGFGQGQSNGAYAMLSGVAASASTFKALVASAQSNGAGPTVWTGTYTKYAFTWDGTNLSAQAEGGVASMGNSPSGWAAVYAAYSYSANCQGILVANNGWLSIGTMGFDASTLATGPDTTISFAAFRIAQTTGACHDAFGGGSVVQSYGTTTIQDTTNRLTLGIEVKDANLGVLGASTCRLSGKSWGGAAPSIGCLSATQTFAQWVDGAGSRWASVAVYDPATGKSNVFGNNYYSGGNLGAYAIGAYGFAPFNSTVTYGIRKDAATTAARFMKVGFDTTKAAGAELYSNAADDIAVSLLAGVANTTVSALSIHGMVKMAADLIVVYGRATVSVGGAASVTMCFAESFAMGV